MNNTIETLQEIRKYYAQDIIRGTETGSKRFKAITKAIATLKAVDEAQDMLRPINYNEKVWGFNEWGMEYNKLHKRAKLILAKQILKNKELEEALNTLMNEVFSGQASMSSYGYKKAQRAKIKDIENG